MEAGAVQFVGGPTCSEGDVAKEIVACNRLQRPNGRALGEQIYLV